VSHVHVGLNMVHYRLYIWYTYD